MGLASFLLIGLWFEYVEASATVEKVFIVNRIGDVSLLLAMFALSKSAGTLAFRDVFAVAPGEAHPCASPSWGSDHRCRHYHLRTSAGRHRQNGADPALRWLPDAMAGPTPVSALIQAATMVTAGVYLKVRSHTLFALVPATSGLVAWVGALIALVGSAIAIGQYDIEKALAYSTVSQLGYMVAGFGVGGVVAAMLG